jgi:TolB-like protein
MMLVAWMAPWRSSGSANALRSVAVMPFEDVGVEHPGQYLVEGIADELSTRLGRSTGLKVAARTSAFALKDRKMDAREIGRALGVDALIEGSVRQANDRVRIGIRLVNARDGYQIWSETWERPLTDMPALQEQIARSVLRVVDGNSASPGGMADAAAIPPAAYQPRPRGRDLRTCHRARARLRRGVQRPR